MQSEGWGLRSDCTLGFRSGAKEHAIREEGFFIVNGLPELPLPPYRLPHTPRQYPQPTATHAPPVLQRNTTAHARGLRLDVKAALTGETMLTSLLADPQEEVRLLLGRLQYRTFKENQDAKGTQIQPMFNGDKPEPPKPLLQGVA